MSRRIARLLALALMSASICFALGNFLFNYSLYRSVPTSLSSGTIPLGGNGELSTPGFLDLYLGSIVWTLAAFGGLYAFLLLPASSRTPKRSTLRQLARLAGLVMILLGAFVALSLLLDKTVGLLGVLAILLGIVPFLCLPISKGVGHE